jgi:tetratricopeptide (TPR) repeat protein
MRHRWRVRRLGTAVLAVGGAVVGALPGLLHSGGVDSGWMAVGAGVCAVAAGIFGEGWRRRHAERAQRDDLLRAEIADGCLMVRGRMGRPRLPLAQQITDPTLVRVHPAVPPAGVGNGNGATSGAPFYVRRDQDARLREAVAAGNFVVIVGDSTAGKSRAAYEAIRAVRGKQTLIFPEGREALQPALRWAKELRHCVILLDDLERFLGAGGGLTRQNVARLLLASRQRDVLLLGTLRTEERNRLATAGTADPTGPDSREVRDLLELAVEIRLERRFTTAERARAEVAAGSDLRIAAAVDHADEYGVAEYLAAGPELLARWRDGWAPGGGHSRGAAIVMAAIDVRRAGMTGPAPRELLVRLHEYYLTTHGGRRLQPEPIDDAFVWALHAERATAALLQGDESSGYEVFDYLVDTVQREAGIDDQVPDPTFRAVLRYATVDEALTASDLAFEYGRYDIADAAIGSAFRRVEALDPGHLDVLAVRHAAARLALKLGKYTEAEAELLAVFDATSRVLGARHPRVLAIRSGLAMLALERAEYDRAEAESRAILVNDAPTLGSDHYVTLSARHMLASVALERGDYVQAESEFQAILDSRVRLLGPRHRRTLSARHNVARVALRRRDYDRAEAEFRAVLEASVTTLGADHPSVLFTRHNLARIAMERGDFAGAEPDLQAVYELRVRLLGADHPETLWARHQRGRLFLERGNHDRAATELQDVVNASRRVLGPDHPQSLAARSSLARLVLAQGGCDQAERELHAILEARRRIFDPDHPDVLATCSDLADIATARRNKTDQDEQDRRP